MGFEGGVKGALDGSIGAKGRLPFLVLEGVELGEEEGDGGRGLRGDIGEPGGLSCTYAHDRQCLHIIITSLCGTTTFSPNFCHVF